MGFQKNKENGSFLRSLFDSAKVFGGVALLAYLSSFYITDKQKDSVRRRDSVCAYPAGKHSGLSNGQNGVDATGHVHHIGTRRTYYDQPGCESPMPDFPENLITLCPEHHLGNKDGFKVVHPDMYFVRAYNTGQLDQLSTKRINQHPDCYAFFVEYARKRDAEIIRKNRYLPKNEQIPVLPRDDAYKAALSAWRADVFMRGEIYWNSENDGIFQGCALRRSRDARKKGWKYPLVEMNRSTAIKHWGEQVWTNMVIFLVEDYVQRMSPEVFESIVSEIENAEFSQKYLGLSNPNGHTSRAIFYQKIYLAAIKDFMPGIEVTGMIQSYLNTVEPDYCKAIFKLVYSADKKDDRKLAFVILRGKIYKPALELHKKKMAQTVRNGGR